MAAVGKRLKPNSGWGCPKVYIVGWVSVCAMARIKAPVTRVKKKRGAVKKKPKRRAVSRKRKKAPAVAVTTDAVVVEAKSV